MGPVVPGMVPVCPGHRPGLVFFLSKYGPGGGGAEKFWKNVRAAKPAEVGL